MKPTTKLCPIEDRRLFYSYFHSFSCFTNVEEASGYLLGVEKLPYIIEHSLFTSIVIELARPFKQSGRKMRFPVEIVPEEFQLHLKKILTIRDKFFAHVDVDDFKNDKIGNFNKVLIEKYRDGIAPVFSYASIAKEDVFDWLPLIQWLIKFSSAIFTELFNLYPCPKPTGQTRYEIDVITKKDRPLYVKMK